MAIVNRDFQIICEPLITLFPFHAAAFPERVKSGMSGRASLSQFGICEDSERSRCSWVTANVSVTRSATVKVFIL
jgi:hypothetical protein